MTEGTKLNVFVGGGGFGCPPAVKKMKYLNVIVGYDIMLFNVGFVKMFPPYNTTTGNSEVNINPKLPTGVCERFRVVEAGSNKVAFWSTQWKCFICVDAQYQINGLNGVKGELDENMNFRFKEGETLSPNEIFSIIRCKKGYLLYNDYSGRYLSVRNTKKMLFEVIELYTSPNISNSEFEIMHYPFDYKYGIGRKGGDTMISDINQTLILRAHGGLGGKKRGKGGEGGYLSSYHKYYVSRAIIYFGGKGWTFFPYI